MRQLLATVRFIAFLLVMLVGAVLVLMAGSLPIRTKAGARLTTVPVGWMANAFLWIFNLRVHCPDREKIRNHAGMIVCNHLSFMDIIVLLSITPIRFMSTAGVRKLPVIGWIATTLDTIFVKRGNQDSRSQARDEAVEKLVERTYPPVAIFPEGVIGKGEEVAPFRYGAFEIARDSNVTILPCALTYTPLRVVHFASWEDTLPGIVWKLATHPGGVQANLIPTEVVNPSSYEDVVQAAEQSQERVAALYRDTY